MSKLIISMMGFFLGTEDFLVIEGIMIMLMMLAMILLHTHPIIAFTVMIINCLCFKYGCSCCISISKIYWTIPIINIMMIMMVHWLLLLLLSPLLLLKMTLMDPWREIYEFLILILIINKSVYAYSIIIELIQ